MKNTVYLVTGLSGAGLSTALKVLEDRGCDVFDNLPLDFLRPLLDKQKPHHRPLAIGMDTRTRDFDAQKILNAVRGLKAGGEWNIRSFFLTAEDAALMRRFTETRRTHPLARDRAIGDGITTEKTLLYPLKYDADAVIDTTEFSIHDLRRVIEGHVEGSRAHKMNISVMSFAYRHGVPREADLVFDMRFLKNPHWSPELKDLTGQDAEVQSYIATDPALGLFESGLKTMLGAALPGYADSGKSYLTLAFGCTGGRHRSVCLAEKTKAWLIGQGFAASAHHRELKA